MRPYISHNAANCHRVLYSTYEHDNVMAWERFLHGPLWAESTGL